MTHDTWRVTIFMHPIVAIVGRPNVGKSRLFNRVVGATRAIVADKSGVTRDRHYAEGEWCGREFIVVDTGGLDLDPAADLERDISRQSVKAIEEADVVICVFDGQSDPTSDDREVVAVLRKVSKPVIFAINKIDEVSHEDRLNAFYELGADPLFAVSAEHGRGVDELLTEAVKHFPPEGEEVEIETDKLSVAVVGRPNVGKSTLINRLSGEERVVAHEVPGTTRDAIDVAIDFEGKEYLFIDTAGVKRRWGVLDKLEKFTAMRSLKTINRAKIVLQLIDGSEGLTKQDLGLTGFIREEGKGLIFIVNKWDKMREVSWEEYETRLRKGMGELADIPVVNISALEGYGCLKIFKAVEKLDHALSRKITTSMLNNIVHDACANHHLPDCKGKEVKIYYVTQTGSYPPTFALFSNYPAAVTYTYRRYLMRKIQEALDIEGVPVKLICRRK